MQERQVPSLGQEDPLEKEMATHSSILAWEIPQTDEPDGLQSMGSHGLTHDSATKPPSPLTKVINWRGSSALERGLRFRGCFCLPQSELVTLVKHSREDVLECKGFWQRLAERSQSHSFLLSTQGDGICQPSIHWTRNKSRREAHCSPDHPQNLCILFFCLYDSRWSIGLAKTFEFSHKIF